MPRLGLVARGRLAPAALHDGGAARVEATAGGRVERARNVPHEHEALAALGGIGNRDRGKQRPRVRVRRCGEQARRRRQLDELAEVHHGDAVRQVPDDGEVVRDEEVGETHVAAQLCEQVHDLSLNRHVERRDRLVEHDELRIERDGARHADALPLAAGEFVRIAVDPARREPHLREQLRDAALGLGAPCQAVHLERLAHDVEHAKPRIERAVRVLEHDLHRAPEAAQVRGAGGAHVGAVEDDAARGRLDEPEQRAPDGRLARPRFAYQAERLTAPELEAHVVDSAHPAAHLAEQAARHRKMFGEPLDREQRLRAHASSAAAAAAAAAT